ELRESEEKYRTTFENTGTAMAILEEDATISLANSRFEKLSGYSKEEIEGKMKWTEFVHPDDLKKMMEYHKERRVNPEEVPKQYEFRAINKNGNILYMLLNVDLIPGTKQSIVSLIDITEKKKMEKIRSVLYKITNAVSITKDLSELFPLIRKYLGEIIDTTNFLIGLYDKEHDTLSFTYKVDEKDKYSSFPLGKTLTAYVIRTGKSLLATEKIIEKLTKAGKIEPIGTLSKVWLGVPLKTDKEVVGVITVQSYKDASAYTEEDIKLLEFVSHQIAIIIKRKYAEETLQFERAQFLSIFDSINEIIYVTDPKTYKILYVNKAFKNAFQKDPVGGICYKEFQGLESPCEFCTNEIILKEKGKTYRWEYHNPILNRDYMIADRIIKWPDGRDVRFELAIDITERKLLERQKEKARKEAEFYSDVLAHDIGNLDQVILGYLYLLKNAKDEETRKKNVEGIKKSIMKSKRLAESIRILKIIKDTKIEKFNLNKSIERSIRDIKEYSDREIEVNLNIDKKY
ncbi:MAG TPA: PAS domain S-box protein, partial [Euryarchaeota archaeon]|nr:PAS domain S-box protein [Euryarchaeota archaeon]